jgi:peptidoglycan/xylan/chitin deacetylase (PgdA/CDA1 family)
VYPDASLGKVDWTRVDAVLVSTHEYQGITVDRLRDIVPPGIEVFAIYDDAGDSLLHVLPGKWPVINALAESSGAAVHTSRSAVDFESHPSPVAITDRYALIVSYHYCHPAEGFLKGTHAITPDELDRQLRVLKQNFVCTTIGELMNPHARLPETVAVVTFDDGFRDVIDYALPVLQRWEVPATVYCSSAPLMEPRVLSAHRSHLLQARLGPAGYREAFEHALAAYGPYTLEPSDRLGLTDLYLYDDEPTRRFKRLVNFELPYPVLDVVQRRLFEHFIGPETELSSKLYLSTDDIRRCQDAGIEIGAHGHQHLVLTRLTEAEQRNDLQIAADYFKSELGISELHSSYPYGAGGCWNETTKRLLAELGFASAATKVRAIVKPSDLNARWELPRFDVRDVFDATGSLMAEKLNALFVAD